MNQEIWTGIIVALCVVLFAGILWKRFSGRRRRRNNCGCGTDVPAGSRKDASGCGGCPGCG